ncbi:MAG: crossover junction endodeoxyribonuclease RuvC [Chloroflexi bacterium]|nr:crossover junction endodeoxyribonuclease RuvC [Chloroflexota bacterium]
MVLGVDPGTAILGLGVLVEGTNRPRLVYCGALTTPAGQPHPLRLLSLFEGVCDVIRTYGVTEMAIEQLFFARNVRTALAVGEARGVVVLAAAQAGLAIGEYTPLQIKQAVGGYGRATKDQVGEMVRLVLGLDAAPSPDDVADAVAVGLCHLSWTQYSRAIAAAEQRQPEGDR